MSSDVLVIGAGVAGLTCARALARAGASVSVVDKGRGVGGRCATRRVNEQPVDHGLAFFHGSDEEFLSALREAAPDAERAEGWPFDVRGEGAPCQPRAFRRGEQRLAFRAGATVFPKHLAEGLDVSVGQRVAHVRREGGRFVAEFDEGEARSARTLVMTAPVQQALALLEEAWCEEREALAARRLVESVSSQRCLVVLAGYARDASRPEFDVAFPERSSILQTLVHDSAKRAEPRDTVLVAQALPAWSRAHWDDTPERWSRALLDEAARLYGAWIREPLWRQPHRWGFARVSSAAELARPLVVAFEGGERLAFAGEAFSSGGGVQAAWRSGLDLARRLSGESA